MVHSPTIPIEKKLIQGSDLQPVNWKKFLNPDLVFKDPPFKNAQKAFKILRKKAYDIHFVTGRNEGLREVTCKWLKKHYKILPPKNHLHMRPEKEMSTATEHKERVLIHKILPIQWSIPPISLVFFADDAFVLNLYSKYGLAFKAPECWDLLIHEKPKENEPLFNF